MKEKSIVLNDAIALYVDYVQKNILGNRFLLNKLKCEQIAFTHSYQSLQKNKVVKLYLNTIKNDWYFPNNEQMTIYYMEKSQVLAFVHLLTEKIGEKKMNINFSKYDNKDMLRLHYSLSRLYFIPKSNYVITDISLI
ncbi:MAG: hypothetical protein K5829_10085 [Treponema sp.]|nr:hypothetical protein [Treponema sp.]